MISRDERDIAQACRKLLEDSDRIADGLIRTLRQTPSPFFRWSLDRTVKGLEEFKDNEGTSHVAKLTAGYMSRPQQKISSRYLPPSLVLLEKDSPLLFSPIPKLFTS